jgi:long-chain acyl-CoA synthetase
VVGTIYKHNYNPEKTALQWKGTAISYGELDSKVSACAAYLRAAGLAKGEKVVLSCMNSPEFVYSYLGTVRLGAVIVPINLMLTMEEIIYIVKDSGAKYMLIHPFIMAKANLTVAVLEGALGVRVIVLDDAFKQSLTETQAKLAGASNADEATDENAISTFLYTSGTTGKQKAAMLSHKNLMTNSDQCYTGLGAEPEDVYMCVLPMFHVFAFTACILMPLYSGATVVILESFQPKEVIESLMQDGITIFMGVPAMYGVLLNAGKKDIHFPKLRRCVSGGAALPVEIYREAREVMKLPVIEGYGLTEASPACSFNPPLGVQKELSIGLPLEGIECKIANDDDEEVPAGEVGELLVRGNNVMQGYWNQSEETEKALRGGWLHTGDLAKKDEDGYIFIVDRKKDMIVVSGLNVYSREVEEVIYQHPAVKEAAVAGIPDKQRGEYVKAFIVLKEGESCTTEDMSHYLAKYLAAYKLPRRIQFIDALPKNSSGKILKRMLRETTD